MWYSLRNVNHVDCMFVWCMMWMMRCLNSLFASVKILSSSLQRSHIFRLKKISLKKRKMFSVFKVLYPASTKNEVTQKVKGFLISRMVARTGSLPPSPCKCAHRVWHQGPNKMNLKCFQMFSCMAYKCFCEKLNCTYWALAHIVLVVGIAGKQPVTRNWWLDLCWRESGGGHWKEGAAAKNVSVCSE